MATKSHEKQICVTILFKQWLLVQNPCPAISLNRAIVRAPPVYYIIRFSYKLYDLVTRAKRGMWSFYYLVMSLKVKCCMAGKKCRHCSDAALD